MEDISDIRAFYPAPVINRSEISAAGDFLKVFACIWMISTNNPASPSPNDSVNRAGGKQLISLIQRKMHFISDLCSDAVRIQGGWLAT